MNEPRAGLGPFRDGCCADWPKPCGYHEGWADGLDHVFRMSLTDLERDQGAGDGIIEESRQVPDQALGGITLGGGYLRPPQEPAASTLAGKDPTRWMHLLPQSHPGSCRWINHPTHRLRSWAVYLLGKVFVSID